jgi:hypothetical protein
MKSMHEKMSYEPSATRVKNCVPMNKGHKGKEL